MARHRPVYDGCARVVPLIIVASWVRFIMLFRRLAVVSIVLLVTFCLGFAMAGALAPGGWTAAKALMLLSCLGAAPWVGFCAANGLIGFVLVLPRPGVPEPVAIEAMPPRTAIALTVRN